MTPSGPEHDDLLTLTNTAEMTGKTLSVVSSWRRRAKDFPLPVQEGPRGGLFRRSEIIAWLELNKKNIASSTIELSELSFFPNYANPFRARLDEGRIQELFTEILVLGMLTRTSQSRSISQRIEAATKMHPSLEGCFGVLELLLSTESQGDVERLMVRVDAAEDELGTAEAFEAILELSKRQLGRDGLAIPQSLSQFLVQLLYAGVSLSSHEAYSYMDPSAGLGDLLVAAVNYAKDGDPLLRAKVCAQEQQLVTSKMLKLRAVATQFDVHIAGGNGIFEPAFVGDKFDFVVSMPPIGLRTSDVAKSMQVPQLDGDSKWPSRMDMLWLQKVAQDLKPGGKAMVILPERTAFARGTDARIRADLVRNDQVEAVMTLPRGLLYGVGIRFAVWFLKHPDGYAPRSEILLIDVPDSSVTKRVRGRADIESDVQTTLINLFEKWRTDGRIVGEEFVDLALVIDQDDLGDGSGSLLPSSWIHAKSQDVAEEQSQVLVGFSKVKSLLESLRNISVDAQVVLDGEEEIDLVNVSDLVNVDRGLRIHPDDYVSEGIPVVTMGTIGTSDSSRFKYVRSKDGYLCSAPGDVLVTISLDTKEVIAEIETTPRVVGVCVFRIRSGIGKWSPIVISHLITVEPARLRAVAAGTIPALRVRAEDLRLPALSSDKLALLERNLMELSELERISTELGLAVNDLIQRLRFAFPRSRSVRTEALLPSDFESFVKESKLISERSNAKLEETMRVLETIRSNLEVAQVRADLMRFINLQSPDQSEKEEKA